MPLIDRLMGAALPLFGIPYVFGGKDVARDGGLDCSGFIVRVFREAGVYDFGNPDLTNVQRIAEQCQPVDVAQPGDLLIFTGTYLEDNGQPATYSHIGFIEHPQPVAIMVDAHDNRGVGSTLYGTDYWQGHFLSVLRAPGVAGVAPAPVDSPWTYDQIASATGCPLEAVQANWPLVMAALRVVGQGSRNSLACAIGQLAIETASTFAPVEEAYWLPPVDRQLYYADTSQHAYYGQFWGRGFIQLSLESNYQAAGDALGVDLVTHPELALEPQTAARIFAWYWQQHAIQEPSDRGDWQEARRRVQGGTAGLPRLIQVVTALLG